MRRGSGRESCSQEGRWVSFRREEEKKEEEDASLLLLLLLLDAVALVFGSWSGFGRSVLLDLESLRGILARDGGKIPCDAVVY